MKIGEKIHQLRKLAGMTQEQLAEKLHVSRQTLSKWEAGTTLPDLESVVNISLIFQLTLDDLLLEKEEQKNEQQERITLEDLTKMNLHNRKMMLFLISGLICLMTSILIIAFVAALRSTNLNIEYMLYRYIAVGEYANAPVDYLKLILPAIPTGIIGILLCLCFFLGTYKKQ